MNTRKGRATPTKPTRAVCYVRVSVDRDNETSTETQEERVRAYCTAHGWQLVDVVIEPGRSAYKASRTSRPGFRRVMHTISTGAADALVVWKLDRACRDTVDTLSLVNDLAEHGAQLASVTEHFDTSTPSGRMTLTVLAALAEMESATKSERVQAWQDKRIADGCTPTGPRPFGYRRERNQLLIDPDEAEIIRECADRVLKGDSLRSILRDLEQRGVKGKNGTPISPRGLKNILTSPTIAACREVGQAYVPSTAWKPILTRAKWDKLRAYLTDPARRSTQSTARRWLLSGIATCSRCTDDKGQPMRMGIKTHHNGPRYFCLGCHLSVEAKRTDDIVQRDLLALLDPRTWRHLRQGRPTLTDTSGFDQAIDMLSERYKAGDIDSAEWSRLADELQRQQEMSVRTTPTLPDVPDIKKAWPKLTLDQKRLVLTAATEALIIKPVDRSVQGFNEKRIDWVPVS